MQRNLSHPVEALLLVPKSLKRTSFCNFDNNISQSGQMQFLQPAQKNLCDPPKSVIKSLPTPFFATLFPDRQLNGLLVTRILFQKIYFCIFSASNRKIITQWKMIFSKSWYSSGKNVFFYIFSAPPPSYTPITLIALSEHMFTTDALAQEQQKVLSLNMRNVCHESRFSTGWTLKGQ